MIRKSSGLRRMAMIFCLCRSFNFFDVLQTGYHTLDISNPVNPSLERPSRRADRLSRKQFQSAATPFTQNSPRSATNRLHVRIHLPHNPLYSATCGERRYPSVLSLPNDARAVSLIKHHARRIPTHRHPRDRLADKSTLDITRQDRHILAVLVPNSDQVPSAVHAELARVASLSLPRRTCQPLYKHAR